MPVMLFPPFVIRVDVEHPLNDGCDLEASDDKGELFGSIQKQNFAVLNREIVERIIEVGSVDRFFTKANKLTVVFQDEVSQPPILNVFGCKKEGGILFNRIISCKCILPIVYLFF
jgi:hypothetical protein